MVTITLIEDPDGAQRQLFDDWAEVFAADGRHQFGPDHTAHSADELREMGRSTARHRIAWAAVHDDGTVVGSAALMLPQHDNLAQALLVAVVHPDHRRRGLGTLLLTHLEEAARAHGRSVLLSETQWRVGADDEFGEGFAAKHGYAVAQTVLRSSLSLPADRARLEAGLQADDADGYVVRTCWDGIPDAWLAGRAELSRRMSTDIPMGDLRLEEEHWDEARVRDEYERIGRMGRRVIDAFAVHEATGELVGYTQVQVPRDHPEVAFQQDTLVMREHRGHRLGLRMKAASTLALTEQSPETASVRTWNADDNAPMLEVNRALGFVNDGMMREWQKVVPA
ncbi:Acetyltransferase (GNAT) family protein [Pedococcus dokdonensis]|uniref:Acetyltransferase (GNAT) family protein n=1 Tax=Pedococcus dokdonensis TaxID=443156 RepID=A0A1H0S6A3_9MICO|nr:GNAT family N-acetyltransferase [Pedococcus dokdonensis]SDP36758.1 Acetyltransferase (GNAT) family protein [Pedococcus dokdonensis]